MTQQPKLWFSRLVVLESYKPELKPIQDISLRPGLNIVWATEVNDLQGKSSTDNEVESIKHAGHGVGKTTFCLMLRALLGDDGKAVKAMLDKLALHFLDGAVAAELYVCGQRYAVCRPFNSLGWAALDCDIESLIGAESRLRFSQFVSELETRLLGNISIKQIPGTQQSINWGHVLAWITRDQGSRLRHFFDWRSDDGTGLHQSKQSPSMLMRIVTGLLTDAEATAQRDLDEAEDVLKRAKLALSSAETESNNVKIMLQSRVRTWAVASNSIPMDTDDLFEDSVRKEIGRVTHRIATSKQNLTSERASVDAKIIEGEVRVRQREQELTLPEIELEQLKAERDGNQARVAQMGIELVEKRRQLQQSGMCETAGISFAKCRHLAEAISDGPQTHEIKTARQIKLAQPHLNQKVNQLEATLAIKRAERDQWKTEIVVSKKQVDLIVKKLSDEDKKLGAGEELVKELELWSRERATAALESLPPKVTAATQVVKSAEAALANARTAVAVAHSKFFDRREQLSDCFSDLAKFFEIQSQLHDADLNRPFQLVGVNGEAYTVLEILLGDAACLLDKNSENHHPRFAILDCTREADMSLRVYQRMISMLAEPRFASCQIVLTTTSEPPSHLQSPPVCVLKLNQLSDDGLLLKGRV